MNAPKNRLIYTLLAVGVGEFGIHNFYIGRRKRAWLQLVLSLTILLIPLVSI